MYSALISFSTLPIRHPPPLKYPPPSVSQIDPIHSPSHITPRTITAFFPGPGLGTTSSLAQPTLLEEGLSVGWELQYDPRGRTFYGDHNKPTTTWTRPPPSRSASSLPLPTAERAKSTTDPAILAPNTTNVDGTYAYMRLPLGWEEPQTSEARPYFVDHRMRTTI